MTPSRSVSLHPRRRRAGLVIAGLLAATLAAFAWALSAGAMAVPGSELQAAIARWRRPAL